MESKLEHDAGLAAKLIYETSVQLELCEMELAAMRRLYRSVCRALLLAAVWGSVTSVWLFVHLFLERGSK